MRRASVVQIHDMRAKVEAGVSRKLVARRMGFSYWTVRQHTKDVTSAALTARQLDQQQAARTRAVAYERIASACNRALGLSFGSV